MADVTIVPLVMDGPVPVGAAREAVFDNGDIREASVGDAGRSGRWWELAIGAVDVQARVVCVTVVAVAGQLPGAASRTAAAMIVMWGGGVGDAGGQRGARVARFVGPRP
jgi:hypothetical protein